MEKKLPQHEKESKIFLDELINERTRPLIERMVGRIETSNDNLTGYRKLHNIKHIVSWFMRETFPDEQYTFSNLDLDYLEHFPSVEIAGPTSKAYEPPLIDPATLEKILITNISEAAVLRQNEELIDRLDLEVDGTAMPFDECSIGTLFASCTIFDTRPGFIHEARRVLIPGGILVYRRCDEVDIVYALIQGFEIVLCEKQEQPYPDDPAIWNVIFKQPLSN